MAREVYSDLSIFALALAAHHGALAILGVFDGHTGAGGTMRRPAISGRRRRLGRGGLARWEYRGLARL